MENKTNESEIGSFKINGNWTAQAKILKEQFSQLNDHDLRFETGKENELLKRVEEKLKKKRDEVINIIKRTEITTIPKKQAPES